MLDQVTVNGHPWMDRWRTGLHCMPWHLATLRPGRLGFSIGAEELPGGGANGRGRGRVWMVLEVCLLFFLKRF